jgi:hypothetical protein
MFLRCCPSFRPDYHAVRVCNTVRAVSPTIERLVCDDGLLCGVDSVDELLRYVYFDPDVLFEVHCERLYNAGVDHSERQA